MSSDESKVLKCAQDCFAPYAKDLGCEATDVGCLCKTDIDASNGLSFGFCFLSKCGTFSAHSTLQNICNKLPSNGSPSDSAKTTQATATSKTPNETDNSVQNTASSTSRIDSSSAPKNTQISPTNSSSSSSSSALSPGAAAGIGIGSAAALIIVVVGFFLLWRRRRQQRSKGDSSDISDDKKSQAELSGKSAVDAEMQGSDCRVELHGSDSYSAYNGKALATAIHELPGSSGKPNQ